MSSRANRGVPIVLLIEHEPSRSVILARILKDGGYSVIPVNRANDALEIFVTHHGDIALVLADTQVATSAGSPLPGALHEIDPHVPVVAMSPAAAIERHTHRYPNVVATLTKPVATADLLGHVRHALEPVRDTPDTDAFSVDGTPFSWPPTEEDLDDIQVVDTAASSAAAATPGAAEAALPLVPSASPEQPAPSAPPAPVIRLVVRERDARRGARRARPMRS